jgi:hypothetical protein
MHPHKQLPGSGLFCYSSLFAAATFGMTRIMPHFGFGDQQSYYVHALDRPWALQHDDHTFAFSFPASTLSSSSREFTIISHMKNKIASMVGKSSENPAKIHRVTATFTGNFFIS